jgi:outer membrane protein assembly factor BamD (BamD/ComL family)
MISSCKGREFFFLLFFLFLTAAVSFAQEPNRITIDESLQLELADQFFKEEDYYRAITEYKRFLFFFPESARLEEVYWRIAKAYFNGQKWDEATSAFDRFIQKFPASRQISEALILKGLCFTAKKEYSQARFFFNQAKETARDGSLADEAQKQLAITYLKEEKWKEAAAEFRKIDKNSILYPKSDYMAQGLEKIDEIPQKSPTMAGILAAVLPGSGHLYSERYRDAAIAFLLNGVFIWGMVESFQQESYVVGGILTFFELGWYSGNIYSAVASAHKYNRKQQQQYIEFLEKGSNLSLGLTRQGKTHFLSLHYVF